MLLQPFAQGQGDQVRFNFQAVLMLGSKKTQGSLAFPEPSSSMLHI